MSRLLNESKLDQTSASRYFLGHVETIDENYWITFSIPGIMENLTKYPTAYPNGTDHVKEVKVGDSVLVQQLDSATQFFIYTQLNKNAKTGIYFGGIDVDISDGTTLKIHTETNPKNGGEKHPIDITINGETGLIECSNDQYSLNTFLHKLELALSTLHTEGGPTNQTAQAWYSATLKLEFQNLFKLFK